MGKGSKSKGANVPEEDDIIRIGLSDEEEEDQEQEGDKNEASRKEKDVLQNTLKDHALDSKDPKGSAALAHRVHNFDTTAALEHVKEIELIYRQTKFPQGVIMHVHVLCGNEHHSPLIIPKYCHRSTHHDAMCGSHVIYVIGM